MGWKVSAKSNKRKFKMKEENLYAGKGVIRTNLGKYINLRDIDIDQIDINDIAHALSNICRWGGHCNNFYSVAEHCIHVVSLMESHGQLNPEDKYSRKELLAGLLHDAVEAYLVDMPSTIKSLLPDYEELESKVEEAIKHRFGIRKFEIVKEWDKISLEMEWDMWINGTMKGVSPKKAKKRFLEVYERLTSIEHNYQNGNDLAKEFQECNFEMENQFNGFDSGLIIDSGNFENVIEPPEELTKEQSYQCTLEEIETDYQRREKLLGEIMAADEKDGLYGYKKEREKDIIITHQIPQPKLKTWSNQLKEWSNQLKELEGLKEVDDYLKIKWSKVGNSHIGRVFGFDIKFIVEQDEIYFYASEVRYCDAGRFDTLEEAKQWCRQEALRLIKIKQK